MQILSLHFLFKYASLPVSPYEYDELQPYHRLPHIIQQNKYYSLYEALNTQSGTIVDYYEFLTKEIQDQVLEHCKLFIQVSEQQSENGKIVVAIREHQEEINLAELIKLSFKSQIQLSQKEQIDIAFDLLKQFETQKIYHPYLENINIIGKNPNAQFNILSKLENNEGRQAIINYTNQIIQLGIDKEQLFLQICNFLDINSYNYSYQLPDFEFKGTEQGGCQLCRLYTKLLKLISANEVEMQCDQDYLQYISQGGKKYIEIIIRYTQQAHKQCDCFVNQIFNIGVNVMSSPITSNILSQQNSQKSLTDSQIREQKLIQVPSQKDNTMLFKLTLFGFLNRYQLFNHAIITVAQTLQINSLSISEVFYKRRTTQSIVNLQLVTQQQVPIEKIIVPFNIVQYRNRFISSQTVLIQIGKEIYTTCVLEENIEFQVEKLYQQYKTINPLITKDKIKAQLLVNPPQWL